jgi:hypothetical protein
LVLVGIAHDRGDAWERGDFGGGALGVAASDQDSGAGVAGVDATDGGSRGAIGIGGDGTGVEDDQLGCVSGG